MREDEGLHFRVAETATHFESIVVGFATHDHRVDGGEERAHGIVLGHEEKIDRAIGAGDVAVEADAEAEDHLAHRRHSKRREVNSSPGVISSSPATLEIATHRLPPTVSLVWFHVHQLKSYLPIVRTAD